MNSALNDIIPVVPYADIRAAHDFLVDVLGFASGGLVESDGKVVHGEVRVGATILHEPTDEDYGQREYGVHDPEGHNWYIATPFER